MKAVAENVEILETFLALRASFFEIVKSRKSVLASDAKHEKRARKFKSGTIFTISEILLTKTMCVR